MTKIRFDVTTIETCKRDFEKAKAELSEWEWESGGYKSLYNSQMNRLIREKELKEKESKAKSKK